MGRIIFVTGTDTGVGKTLLTASLLHYLQAEGKRALALKPFCSGGREDALLLHSLQSKDITLAEVNPFYFAKPLAPYLAANAKQRQKMQLRAVLQHVRTIAQKCEILLVEGAGGVLVPVGENWYMKDLIEALDCEVILVSFDKLGTLNHTLLTVEALSKTFSRRKGKVVLMGQAKPDLSAKYNGKFLAKALAPVPVLRVGFLGAGADRVEAIKRRKEKIKKALARMVV